MKVAPNEIDLTKHVFQVHGVEKHGKMENSLCRNGIVNLTKIELSTDHSPCYNPLIC
jgi:hypothetical protein